MVSFSFRAIIVFCRINAQVYKHKTFRPLYTDVETRAFIKDKIKYLCSQNEKWYVCFHIPKAWQNLIHFTEKSNQA